MQLPDSQKGFTTILLLVVILFIIGGGVYYFGTKAMKSQKTFTTEKKSDLVPTESQKPEEITADWTVFKSISCGFSLKTPPSWKVENTSGSWSTYAKHCNSISAPDFYAYPLGDSTRGLKIIIVRTKSSDIHNLDEYIADVEKGVEPHIFVSNLMTKKYGLYEGKYFEYPTYSNFAHFIFMKGDYIYDVIWDVDYAGQYKKDIDPIISSIGF